MSAETKALPENWDTVFNEALFILDKNYPELKLETWRYTKYIFERLATPEHLKAIYDRMCEIAKERDEALEQLDTLKLAIKTVEEA